MSETQDKPALNTDREIWREREGDYYSDSIHVTEGGGIGINCGGYVIVRRVRAWHQVMQSYDLRLRQEEAAIKHAEICAGQSAVSPEVAQPISSGGERQCPNPKCGSDDRDIREEIYSSDERGVGLCRDPWHDQPTPAAQPVPSCPDCHERVSSLLHDLKCVKKIGQPVSAEATKPQPCGHTWSEGNKAWGCVLPKGHYGKCQEYATKPAPLEDDFNNWWAFNIARGPIRNVDVVRRVAEAAWDEAKKLASVPPVVPPEAEGAAKFVRLWSAAQRYFVAESDPDGPVIREELRQVLKDTEPSDEMCITADRVEAEGAREQWLESQRFDPVVACCLDEMSRLRTEISRLTAERDKYDLALHSLTVGGSEFAHDAAACVAHVKARQHSQHELIVKNVLRVKELEAANTELRTALQKLLELANKVDDGACEQGYGGCDAHCKFVGMEMVELVAAALAKGE